jgi:hypothetical protein
MLSARCLCCTSGRTSRRTYSVSLVKTNHGGRSQTLVLIYSVCYFCPILAKIAMRRQISATKSQIRNFIKIRLVGIALFHANGQTERRQESLFVTALCTRLRSTETLGYPISLGKRGGIWVGKANNLVLRAPLPNSLA